MVSSFNYFPLAMPSSIISSALQTWSFQDTISFQDLLKKSSNDESYEDVSYVVESLFTSISVQDSIDYILQRIVMFVKKLNIFVKNQYSQSCY